MKLSVPDARHMYMPCFFILRLANHGASFRHTQSGYLGSDDAVSYVGADTRDLFNPSQSNQMMLE